MNEGFCKQFYGICGSVKRSGPCSESSLKVEIFCLHPLFPQGSLNLKMNVVPAKLTRLKLVMPSLVGINHLLWLTSSDTLSLSRDPRGFFICNESARSLMFGHMSKVHKGQQNVAEQQHRIAVDAAL